MNPKPEELRGLAMLLEKASLTGSLNGMRADAVDAANFLRQFATILEAPGKVSAERALAIADLHARLSAVTKNQIEADVVTLIREALASRATIAAKDRRIAELEGALNYYADKRNWEAWDMADANEDQICVEDDRGDIARQALQGAAP